MLKLSKLMLDFLELLLAWDGALMEIYFLLIVKEEISKYLILERVIKQRSSKLNVILDLKHNNTSGQEKTTLLHLVLLLELRENMLSGICVSLNVLLLVHLWDQEIVSLISTSMKIINFYSPLEEEVWTSAFGNSTLRLKTAWSHSNPLLHLSLLSHFQCSPNGVLTQLNMKLCVVLESETTKHYLMFPSL